MEKRKQLIFLEDSKGIVKTKNKNGHLYVLSNDEIEESDYCYSYKTNKIVKATCDVSREANKNIGFWEKVIATTDKTLSQTNRTEIPQPSQQFIQKFVEEYNRGNIITNVLVEYELISNEEYFLNTINPDDDVPYFDERLKISHKDNTITIKKVKDSYTREQVDRMLDEQASRTTAEMMEKFKDYKSKEEVVKIAMDCIMYGYNGLPNNLTPIQGMNKWIEENL